MARRDAPITPPIPRIGQIVFFNVGEANRARNGGALVTAAIITKVYNLGAHAQVNLRLFLDSLNESHRLLVNRDPSPTEFGPVEFTWTEKECTPS